MPKLLGNKYIKNTSQLENSIENKSFNSILVGQSNNSNNNKNNNIVCTSSNNK